MKKVIVAILLGWLGFETFVLVNNHILSKKDIAALDQELKVAGCKKADWSCEYNVFTQLAEEALSLRAGTIRFYNSLVEYTKTNDVLTSEQINIMHEGVGDYVELRKKLFGFIYKVDKNLGYSIEVINDPSRDGVIKDFKAVQGKREGTDYGLVLNWAKPEGRELIERLRTGLAAALILFDNYTLAVMPFVENKKLRRIIDRDNSEYNMVLQKSSANYASLTNLYLIYRAIMIEEDFRKVIAEESPSFLTALISSSPTREYIVNNPLPKTKRVLTSLKWFKNAFRDQSKALTNNVLGLTSKGFGNAVGLVETRKGKLYQREDVLFEMNRKLRPLDILLEKTPFRLTDKLIPGFWGHAAVWVGTKKDWVEAGLQDHPLFKKYKKLIESGHGIVEALRDGVKLSRADHFINIDDLMVIRPNGLSEKDRQDFMVRALEQVNKPYDFNFDVESDKKIVCSELIYVTYYRGYKWPTENVMGRSTISPDQVAQLAKDESRFSIPLAYRNGIKATVEAFPPEALGGRSPTSN